MENIVEPYITELFKIEQNSNSTFKAVTRFDVSDDRLTILNELPGVQSCLQLYRYEFHITVGDMFTLDEVRASLIIFFEALALAHY